MSRPVSRDIYDQIEMEFARIKTRMDELVDAVLEYRNLEVELKQLRDARAAIFPLIPEASRPEPPAGGMRE